MSPTYLRFNTNIKRRIQEIVSCTNDNLLDLRLSLADCGTNFHSIGGIALTLVDFHRIKPGMKVKIVDQWGSGCGQNEEGFMDQYLGKILTVCVAGLDNLIVEEDSCDPEAPMRTVHGHTRRGWYWYPAAIEWAAIECVVDDFGDFETASDEEFMHLILGI